MLKVNNKDSLLDRIIKKTLQHRRRPGVFIVNFEHILHPVLVFLLLTFSMLMLAGKELLILFVAFLF